MGAADLLHKTDVAALPIAPMPVAACVRFACVRLNTALQQGRQPTTAAGKTVQIDGGCSPAPRSDVAALPIACQRQWQAVCVYHVPDRHSWRHLLLCSQSAWPHATSSLFPPACNRLCMCVVAVVMYACVIIDAAPLLLPVSSVLLLQVRDHSQPTQSAACTI